MIYNSIWRDTNYVRQATGETPYIDYKIMVSGDTIFQGRSYAAPLTSAVTININRVAQNYLYQEFPTVTGDSKPTSAVATFVLYTDDDWTDPAEKYKFIYCWDYDFNWDGDQGRLSYDDNRFPSGYSAYCLNTILSGTLTEVHNQKTVITSGTCKGDYMLYFLNRKGGWQHFLIEGKVVEKDTISRQTMTMFVSNTSSAHSKSDFFNEVTKKWELHTHYMTDSEATRFAKNMFPSPTVYLHRLSDDKIIPVNITDTEAEYKNFHNEKNLISYTINIESSQSMNYVG